MLKRSTPIMLKKLSINTPKDIHKKLSIDPQKGFSPKMYISQEILASYLYFHLLGHLTHF
jgi:hypothetical protein